MEKPRWSQVKGRKAAALRQRKYALVRELGIPEELVGGSLALIHRRCGDPTCHCASDEKGHPGWTLTFMVNGKKRTESIPHALVDELQPLVRRAREYKDAVAEVFAINAQLMVLWKREQRTKGKKL